MPTTNPNPTCIVPHCPNPALDYHHCATHSAMTPDAFRGLPGVGVALSELQRAREAQLIGPGRGLTSEVRQAIARVAGQRAREAGITCNQVHSLAGMNLNSPIDSDVWNGLVDGWHDEHEALHIGTCMHPGCKSLVEGSKRCFAHSF